MWETKHGNYHAESELDWRDREDEAVREICWLWHAGARERDWDGEEREICQRRWEEKTEIGVGYDMQPRERERESSVRERDLYHLLKRKDKTTTCFFCHRLATIIPWRRKFEILQNGKFKDFINFPNMGTEFWWRFRWLQNIVNMSSVSGL